MVTRQLWRTVRDAYTLSRIAVAAGATLVSIGAASLCTWSEGAPQGWHTIVAVGGLLLVLGGLGLRGRTGSRSEGKYPREGTWKDEALQVAGTVVDNLPTPLSVPVSLLLSRVTPPLERLRIAFIDDLAAKVRYLEETVDGFTIDDNEAFASFVAGAVQSAVATAEAEKRTMLRNAALNVALGEADHAEHLRHLLDQLTVLHIGVLRFFASPPPATGTRRQDELRSSELVESAAAMLMRRVPALYATIERSMLEAVIQDLWDRRLLPFPRVPPPTLHQPLIDLYTIDGPRVTPLGARLLEFVREPLSDPIR